MSPGPYGEVQAALRTREGFLCKQALGILQSVILRLLRSVSKDLCACLPEDYIGLRNRRIGGEVGNDSVSVGGRNSGKE